jgi:hypothetical protein
MTDRIDTEAHFHTALQRTPSATGQPLEDPAHPVDLEGLLYLPTKAVQDEKVRDAFRMFPADIAKQYAAEKVLEVVVHAGEGTIGMCAAAIETFLYNAKNIADGDDLNAAVKREYGVGACLEFCSGVLPEGFVAAVKDQFVKPGSVSPGAKAVEATLFEAPDFAAFQATLIANCRDGQQYAFSHGVTSAEDLRTALEHNPAFAERYRNDIAFKLGADAVVWAFIHDQSAAIASTLPATAAPTSVELRG